MISSYTRCICITFPSKIFIESHAQSLTMKNVFYRFVLNVNFRLLTRCLFQHGFGINNLKFNFRMQRLLQAQFVCHEPFPKISKTEFTISSFNIV